MNNAVVRGQWMNDSNSDSCLSCAKSFDIFVWRHHCRRCGGLFCEACSLRKLHIPEAMLVNVTSSSTFYKPDVSAYNRCCDSCAVIVENYNDLHQLSDSQSDTVTINSGGTEDAMLGAISTAESSISTSSLITSPPTLSCSSEKTETQSNSASSSAISLPRSALREVACEEWKGGAMGGGKHKSYSITVPQYLSSERKFLVSLDERIMTIILPVDIMPGEMISVKAPSPSTSIRRAVASTVLTHSKKVNIFLDNRPSSPSNGASIDLRDKINRMA
jgi:FYVE zinc finger